MAQVLKKEIKNKIIDVARNEFLEVGFINASMRSISKKAECSLSNIYNYFDDKDAIFEIVISATLSKLSLFKKNLKKAEADYLKFDKSEAYFDNIVDFLLENRLNLQLLAFRSKGSKFEKYISEWIDSYSEYEYSSLRKKARGHKEIFKKLPSKFFVQSLCIYFFNAALELIDSNLDEEKLSKQLDEIFGFVYNGWGYYID